VSPDSLRDPNEGPDDPATNEARIPATSGPSDDAESTDGAVILTIEPNAPASCQAPAAGPNDGDDGQRATNQATAAKMAVHSEGPREAESDEPHSLRIRSDHGSAPVSRFDETNPFL
jgi:hypothetical protein